MLCPTCASTIFLVRLPCAVAIAMVLISTHQGFFHSHPYPLKLAGLLMKILASYVVSEYEYINIPLQLP